MRDLTRERVLIQRETLFYIPTSDGYNVHITEFFNEYRGVQNVILPHEEARVVAYLRGKLRGLARKVHQQLRQQQFAIIEQFLNRCSERGERFEIMRDISDFYA